MTNRVTASVALLAIFASALGAQEIRPSSPGRDSIRAALEVVRSELGVPNLPIVDDFALGDRTISADTNFAGSVGLYRGTLTVMGRVTGSVVVLDGDLRLMPGSSIGSDAVVLNGQILEEGGVVEGARLTLTGALSPSLPVPSTRGSVGQTMHELGLAFTTLAITILLGLGVLMLASPHLAATTDALQEHPGRSFLVGIVAQAALLPGLALLVVALAITLLGILLIPFAIVAFFLAVAGLGALGLFATAQVAGSAIGARKGAVDMPDRRRSIRSLIVGLMVLGAIWIASALLTAVPLFGAIARVSAFAVTWVAVTAGLGAAVSSRAGFKKEPEPEPEEEVPISWQTPTPVSGVAAARRPTATSGADR